MSDKAQGGAAQALCLHARRSPSARAFAETMLARAVRMPVIMVVAAGDARRGRFLGRLG
jgi:hypothetical protein